VQPAIGMGMSSTDLNNEDYFSDHPKRLPSFDALFRAQAPPSPEHFFRKLQRQTGDNHCSQDDYQRAVFLFRRLQSVRRTISKLIFFFVVMSLVPFVCAELPEEWRLVVWVNPPIGGRNIRSRAAALRYEICAPKLTCR
jgi:hypothetical protein